MLLDSKISFARKIFESKFVDNPTKEHEKIKDPHLERKIRTWGSAFLSILVEYYKRIQVEGIFEPEKVTEFTKEYRQDSDIFSQFLDDTILETKHDIENVTTDVEICDKFVLWCNDRNIKSNILSKQEIKKLLRDNYGSPKAFNTKKKGLRKGFLVTFKDEIEIEDEEN